MWFKIVGKMNSSCEVDRYHVMNVDEVDFRKMSPSPVDFTTRHDHAKWAVSTNRKGRREAAKATTDNILCVGEIQSSNHLETALSCQSNFKRQLSKLTACR